MHKSSFMHWTEPAVSKPSALVKSSALLNQQIVDAMLTNPVPDIGVRELYSQGAIVECHPRRPDFLPAPLTQFLEMQGRMVWVGFE